MPLLFFTMVSLLPFTFVFFLALAFQQFFFFISILLIAIVIVIVSDFLDDSGGGANKSCPSLI
jgi:hypothetical protein